MIVFAIALITWGLYNLFGSWQPEPRRRTHQERVEAEFQVAVQQIRRDVEAWEQGVDRWP